MNQSSDLNNKLFELYDRLDSLDASDENLEKRLAISKQQVEVAETIIENGKLALEAQVKISSISEVRKLPLFLEQR